MVGQIVISKAGHDKDRLYVITAEEQEFVYLADGKLKKPESPKKKRRKHIQPINTTVEETLKRKLESGACVQPEEIRAAIRQFEENSR